MPHRPVTCWASWRSAPGSNTASCCHPAGPARSPTSAPGPTGSKSPSVRSGELQVLLWRRAEPPLKGRWSLPGGFVRKGEPLEDAARRILH
ncbi:MAG: NUDIX hydrolase, partial [Deltaproteobacteria bacterium]|nr:NUDIX hydrolase [Deltaproteobacteria bacterium]